MDDYLIKPWSCNTSTLASLLTNPTFEKFKQYYLHEIDCIPYNKFELRFYTDLLFHFNRELSDVDKYSQSLDKSRFYDARDKIGVEADKFAAFLKYLREKSSLVAVIFLTEGTKRRQPEVNIITNSSYSRLSHYV